MIQADKPTQRSRPNTPAQPVPIKDNKQWSDSVKGNPGNGGTTTKRAAKLASGVIPSIQGASDTTSNLKENFPLAHQAGVSKRALSYLQDKVNPGQRDKIIKSDAYRNTISALNQSETVPKNAIVIDKLTPETRAKIEKGAGKTFVLRGDFVLKQPLKLASDSTVYVDGKVSHFGKYNPTSYDDENRRKYSPGRTAPTQEVQAAFLISQRQNVRLVGVNNSTIESNGRSTGIYTEASKNVEISGLKIKNTWEGVSVHGISDKLQNENIKIHGNYIQNTAKRGIWSTYNQGLTISNNLIENAGADGIDMDAMTEDARAYENVMLGWRRWAGFTEEGSQKNAFIRNTAIMAEFPYYFGKEALANSKGLREINNHYTMGFADSGTALPSIPRATKDNYFIENQLWRPSSYARTPYPNDKTGGRYSTLAPKNHLDPNDKTNPQEKWGTIYFFGNGGSFGGEKTNFVNTKARWKDETPQKGVDMIDETRSQVNKIRQQISTNSKP